MRVKTISIPAQNQKQALNKMNSNYKVGDLIYDGINTNLTDLQFYKRWLPKNKDARVLELCCGTGRLTLPIAKDGYDISGVDYTSSMLKEARRKASEEGLEVAFIEADIRTLDLLEKLSKNEIKAPIFIATSIRGRGRLGFKSSS